MKEMERNDCNSYAGLCMFYIHKHSRKFEAVSPGFSKISMKILFVVPSTYFCSILKIDIFNLNNFNPLSNLFSEFVCGFSDRSTYK